jgi:propionyl-CoA carboxylase beta chain
LFNWTKSAPAALGGGEKRIDAQHAKGKLTARERIELLLDEGTFEEWDMFVEHRCADFGMEENKIPGDGVVTGYGTINGRLVFVFSQDFTVFGGALSEAHAEKICKIMDHGDEGRRAGHRPERLGRRAHPGRRGGARRLCRRVPAQRDGLGVIPQISMIMGPCAGGAVYSPAMTDFIFMVKDSSYMFVTGPEVVKTVTNEEVTAEELGGAVTHTTKSGVADLAFENDVEALLMLRRLLQLPAARTTAKSRRCGRAATRSDATGPALDTPGAGQPEQALRHEGADPEDVDDGDFFEMQPERQEHRHRLRAHGRPDGRHRRQPADGAGRRLDIEQLARRRASCASATPSTSRSSPSWTCRASCRAPAQEYGGIIKHGAKLLFAYAECTVPKVT